MLSLGQKLGDFQHVALVRGHGVGVAVAGQCRRRCSPAPVLLAGQPGRDVAADTAACFPAFGIVAVPLQADLERLQHVHAWEGLLPFINVCLRDGELARIPGQREAQQRWFRGFWQGRGPWLFRGVRQGRLVRFRVRRGGCRLRQLRASRCVSICYIFMSRIRSRSRLLASDSPGGRRAVASDSPELCFIVFLGN